MTNKSTRLAGLRTRLRPIAAVARNDGGAVMDFVIIFPFVLLLTFVIIQIAIYYHAKSVAMKAAENDLRQAAAQYGNAAIGTAAAYEFIGQAGGTMLTGPVVVTDRTPYSATVTITSQTISLVPWVHFTVHVTQSSPVERITYPGMS